MVACRVRSPLLFRPLSPSATGLKGKATREPTTVCVPPAEVRPEVVLVPADGGSSQCTFTVFISGRPYERWDLSNYALLGAG